MIAHNMANCPNDFFTVQGYSKQRIAWNSIKSRWEIQSLQNTSVSYGYFNDTSIYPIGRQQWYINDICHGKEVEFSRMTLKVRKFS